MKKIAVFALLLSLTSLCVRADVLFSDIFNYPDGCIETDGLWYAYSPSSPHQDALVANHLLILNQDNYDAVAAPFTNNAAPNAVYASFTINVSKLPTGKGGYFCIFKDNTNDYVSHIFIDTLDTSVPGTYRLGVANFGTSITTSGATNFPMDLATDITYQVVFSWDETGLGATLWVNPASEGDQQVYGLDTTANTLLQTLNVSQIGFSQYYNQGIAAIGNVMVGTTFTDVVTNAPHKPVIGIQPQGANVYSGNDETLYTAASGTGPLSYQWLADGVPLSDGGSVLGSSSNIITLSDLQSTANYSVVITDGAGSVTSAVATVSVDTTPTLPFFTLEPQSQTNAIGSIITLTATADGSGPISYQWYFEPTNSTSFSPLSTGATLTLANVTDANSGQYYVIAMNNVGSSNSDTVNVLVTPPPTVSIGSLHNQMIANDSGDYNINGTQEVNVHGMVTTFGPMSASSKLYAEYYIQDNTGGIYVYFGNAGTNAVPAAGSLVSITGTVQVYGGQLEIDPGSTNDVTVLSTGNSLPAPQLLNFPLIATNSLGDYGIQIQDALVTVTNAYFYANKTGGAVSGSFYKNGYTTFYVTEGTYDSVSNTNSIEVYATSYGGDATNFWNQPIPGQAYQFNAVLANYDGAAELDPTRLVDFVTTPPSVFTTGLTVSNGVPQLTWPAIPGSTYSVYGATNLLGPWTRTFGLSYYPSTGIYTDTNAVPVKFYRISSP
jgi:DNA/RNA endonuclease YhcR with UshA esterase domain